MCQLLKGFLLKKSLTKSVSLQLCPKPYQSSISNQNQDLQFTVWCWFYLYTYRTIFKKKSENNYNFFFPIHIDNELQGTNSSGSLGGLDVRRRIPIKLISKQANKVKPAPRTQRTVSRMPAKAAQGDEGNLFKLKCSSKIWHPHVDIHAGKTLLHIK